MMSAEGRIRTRLRHSTLRTAHWGAGSVLHEYLYCTVLHHTCKSSVSQRICPAPSAPLYLTKRLSGPCSPWGLFLSGLGFLASRICRASRALGCSGATPGR